MQVSAVLSEVRTMFIGSMIFALVAILCIVAGVVVMRRSRASGGGDDGFDFDKYEGFDK
jgi:hypothetical protein